MIRKIYITGPVGSGKSTLSRRLARECGFAVYEMDFMVYRADRHNRPENGKYTDTEREALFADALRQDRWIMEDAGRALFEEAWRQADLIVFLVPPLPVRLVRIVTRWLKQNLGLEACGYRPDLRMLRLMFTWTKGFETGANGVRERLVPYQHKVRQLRTKQDVARFVEELKEGCL